MLFRTGDACIHTAHYKTDMSTFTAYDTSTIYQMHSEISLCQCTVSG